MKRIVVGLLLSSMALLQVGCGSAPPQPSPVRQALVSLSDRAAQQVIRAPDWTQALEDVVMLVADPEVDRALGIEVERFREHLSRALLAQRDGPQVIDATPGMTEAANDNQWLLESRLLADGPRLRLSDRELLPYKLTLTLRRPGEENPRWQQQLTGAIDTTAL